MLIGSEATARTMRRNNTPYHKEAAKVSRWFSKDGANMPVYYDREGKAVPVMRDEQDRWLAMGYALAKRYSEGSYYTPLWVGLPILLFTAMGLYYSEYSPIHALKSDARMALLMIGGIPMVATFVISGEIRYRRDLAKLRKQIEQKLYWRNNIAAPLERKNAFHILAWILVVTSFGSLITMAVVPGAPKWMIAVLCLMFPTAILATKLAGKLDKANIRQTGKWFRWLGRRH